MGNYLNPGNDMFYKMVHSEIYVDKTGLIGYFANQKVWDAFCVKYV